MRPLNTEYYLDEPEDDIVATPFCGVCDSQLIPKTDDHYPDRMWFTCPECKAAIEHNADLESLNAALEEKWLKAERLYNDLQAHISALLM